MWCINASKKRHIEAWSKKWCNWLTYVYLIAVRVCDVHFCSCRYETKQISSIVSSETMIWFRGGRFIHFGRFGNTGRNQNPKNIMTHDLIIPVCFHLMEKHYDLDALYHESDCCNATHVLCFSCWLLRIMNQMPNHNSLIHFCVACTQCNSMRICFPGMGHSYFHLMPKLMSFGLSAINFSLKREDKKTLPYDTEIALVVLKIGSLFGTNSPNPLFLTLNTEAVWVPFLLENGTHIHHK